MTINKNDFMTNWGSIPVVGQEKIKIGKFEFNKENVMKNPYFTILMILCSDPTSEQKKILDQLDIFIVDDLGQSFWPKKEKTDTKETKE